MNNNRLYFVLVIWVVLLFGYSTEGGALGLVIGLTIISIIDYFDEKYRKQNSEGEE